MNTLGFLHNHRSLAGALLLLLGLLGEGEQALAEPVMLVGTLIEVNEPGQELIVQVHGGGAYAQPHGGYPSAVPTLLRVRLREWEDPEGALQRLRHMNMHRPVRMWGELDPGSADLFWATMVLGGGGGGGGGPRWDPTGVRSRLGRGCPLPPGAVEDEDEPDPPPPGRGMGGFGHGRGSPGGGRGHGGGGR